MTEVPAGDIAAVAKLNDTTHRRRARARAAPRSRSTPFAPPEPVLAVAIHAQVEGRRGQARQRAAPPPGRGPGAAPRAQPARRTRRCSAGMGETHLSIALERLPRKFGVEVETEDVKVAYRETITGNAEAEGKLQEADRWPRPVRRRVRCASSRPSAASGFEFVDKIVGGVIPRQFIPAVEKGVARDDGAGRRARLPGRRREGHVLRRQVPLGRQLGDELQDGRRRSGSRRRWRRPARSCSSRSASSS